MSQYVSSHALDIVAIDNHGIDTTAQGCFHLFQCPKCEHIYVYDDGYLRIYFDPTDVSRYFEDSKEQDFRCGQCDFLFPSTSIVGNNALPEFKVLWKNLVKSEWRWIAKYNPAFGDML